MADEAKTSPFMAQDIDQNCSDYWVGRRKFASAMRELIECATVADLAAEDVDDLATEALNLAAKLRQRRQLRGVIAHADAHGSLPIANHEILCVGGESHPMAPGLRHWQDGDQVRGRVAFNWAYEGPPGCVHGGWVAAIFDHFMGMAQMRLGWAGMTGSLSVSYQRPTPLHTTLDLLATAEPINERKTRIVAELSADQTVTARAEALFIRPRNKSLFSSGAN